MADIGTHWMDLAQYLIGLPIRVGQCRPGHVPPPPAQAHRADRDVHRLGGAARPAAVPGGGRSSTDDHAAVLLRFDSGVRGAFHVSQVTAGRKNRLTIEIAATEASAVRGTASRPTGSGSARARGPNQVLQRDPALLGPAAAAISPLSRRARRGLPRHVQATLYRHLWLDRRKAGRPAGPPSSRPSPTATSEVRLCEAIARSAADGRWVSVGD